jgi:DMSO/TMAO reductase YedYZ molybdopterin-dependent catalytic subunit
MDRGHRELPPGQRAIEGFPRFGTHLSTPAPAVPADPEIEIRGDGLDTFTVPLAELAKLPRRELSADFHCVAGWSATGLRWEGVPFASFYREIVEPSIRPGTAVTHLGFRGLDRYRFVVLIDDALADDVLLAEHLDGRPLDSDHGAPLRLVSPGQYGYVNVKHLSRIELHTTEPESDYALSLRVLSPHPRARVWEEERHCRIPGWALRLPYRTLIAPIRLLSRSRD